jgi:CheY-like chemotaxis protein/nitrogen-specific signal transduction histidine kinase
MAKRKRKKSRKKSHKPPPRRKARNLATAAGGVEAALAGIAHDIRTPLTGIVALADLLSTSDLGQREHEWAQAIKSGADHLAALTSLIVDAAKSEATGLVLRNDPFSPRALAEAVGHALTARANNRSVKAEVTIARDLPAMVAGDVLRLRAALENLADNAVKFTHDGGVHFSAAAEPAAAGRVRLIFIVTDSGIGMSSGESKLLFRPFAQASEAIARRYGGAGLGLVFVKRIAKIMGGDLTVTSKKGSGSTFRLTAVVERVQARGVVEQSGTRDAPARALALLCAEDNPYGRVIMNTILGELGHHVDFVESGEAAVKAVAGGSYDAVLMDVALSGLDGIKATRQIRALPGKAGQVPVVGISGRSDSGNEAEARAAGMNFYFAKPVGPSKLAQALHEITIRPRESGDAG